jgi:hypothetical protein
LFRTMYLTSMDQWKPPWKLDISLSSMLAGSKPNT